jgi:hypothetical protein
MTNLSFLKELKETDCFAKFIDYLGEHGHGHYHSSNMIM